MNIMLFLLEFIMVLDVGITIMFSIPPLFQTLPEVDSSNITSAEDAIDTPSALYKLRVDSSLARTIRGIALEVSVPYIIISTVQTACGLYFDPHLKFILSVLFLE